jgi:hypothetical protein
MSGAFDTKPGGGSLVQGAVDADGAGAPGARNSIGAPGKTTLVEQAQAPVQQAQVRHDARREA